MENGNLFTSKDFYLSAVILATGKNLIKVDRHSEKFAVFVIDISQVKAQKIIESHWKRELLLPTRDLIEAIHELKTRLHVAV